MSIKLYEGWKIPNYSRKELKEFVKHIRSQIVEERKKLYQNRFSSIATNIMDIQNIYKKEAIEILKEIYKTDISQEEYPFFLAFSVFEKRVKEAKLDGRINPFYDMDCQIVLFPIEDKILMTIYTAQHSFKEIIKKHPDVEFYGYWDNTDPQEDCSEEEWEQRGKDWHEAMGETWIPSVEGFTVDLTVDSDTFPEEKELLKSIAPFEKRVNMNAEKVVVLSKQKEILSENPLEKHSYKLANDFALSLEGKLQIEMEKERLKKVLPYEYTRDDLFKSFKEFIAV